MDNTQDFKDNRQIRIFISSTFRDMQDERTYLITKVFPALRRYCEEREVSLIELDLRWGISEEEAKQGKVFDICLREVRRTKPFFIGLLGERYGWIPNEAERKAMAANTSLFEDFPWMEKELVDEGTSITEIEMQEGVLRQSEKVNAYFYLRSPKIKTPEEFIEKSGSHEATKLAALKQTLRGQSTYPVKDYDSIEQLGTQVENDFKALVDKLFPQTALSPLEKERLEQRNFLKGRTRVYVPNPQWDAALDNFIASNEKAMVIVGESGMGKSALVANWISKRLERKIEGVKHICHFIGASRSGGDYHKITQRLIDEVRDLYNIPVTKENAAGIEMDEGNESDKNAADKQKEELQELLFANTSGKLIIILEGINRLSDDAENAKLLNWLPAFPDNVKVIYSTEPGDTSMEVFERWGCQRLAIDAAPPASRNQLVKDYLKSFSKSLKPEQEKRLGGDKKCENPLVLLAILDELRVFGVHEKLDDQIGYYLAAQNNESVFVLILQHIEELYKDDKSHNSLVKDILSLLAVSRYGLSEKEILEISGVAPLHWSQLLNAMAGQLVIMNGYVSFSNRMIQKAVRKLYLPDTAAEKTYRARIVSYMETNGQVAFNRKCDELPYQLFALEDWDKLYALLLDYNSFYSIYKKDKFEAGKYWRTLREADSKRYSPEKYLETGKTLDNFDAFTLYLHVSRLVSDVWGNSNLSLQFLIACSDAHSKEDEGDEDDRFIIAGINNNIGICYLNLSDYKKAVEYFADAIDDFEEIPGDNQRCIAVCYGNIGYCFFKLGNYSKAIEYNEQAIAGAKETLGENHPDIAGYYNQIGISYARLGNKEQAFEYHNRVLAIREKVFGKKHLTTANSYYNIGISCHDSGDYENALKYLEEALAIRESVLGKMHPDIAAVYDSIGAVYSKLRDKKKSFEYMQKGLAIREAVLGKNHPDTALSYNNIADCYRKMWRTKKALEYLEKALVIRQTVLGENVQTATSYNNIGTIYANRHNFKKAVSYYEKALPIFEAVLGSKHSNTADVCFQLAVCYYHLIENKKALEHFEKAFPMFIALGNEVEIKKCGEWLNRAKEDTAGTEGIPAKKQKKWRSKNKTANFLLSIPPTHWIGMRILAGLAKEGYADAQNSYGISFFYGNGVKEDKAKGYEWYRKAAEQGHPAAQGSLGICYERGEGTEQDYAQAFEWYSKSAEQGDHLSQLDLGNLYNDGHGVEQDYAQAAAWYYKAAIQGEKHAQYRLGILYADGKGVEQDYAQALAWLHKSAKQGNVHAQHRIGSFYQYGKGVEQDYAKAAEWYGKAAKQGYGLAQESLDELKSQGLI